MRRGGSNLGEGPKKGSEKRGNPPKVGRGLQDPPPLILGSQIEGGVPNLRGGPKFWGGGGRKCGVCPKSGWGASNGAPQKWGGVSQSPPPQGGILGGEGSSKPRPKFGEGSPKYPWGGPKKGRGLRSPSFITLGFFGGPLPKLSSPPILGPLPNFRNFF